MAVVFNVNAEVHAQAPTKLTVGGQNSGTSTPSTSEGSPQGHQCPTIMLQGRDKELTFAAGCDILNDETTAEQAKMVMGRYAMGMTEEDFLGEGSFSLCRRGTNIMTGEAVAIKVYKVPQSEVDEQANRTKFARQVAVLRHLLEEEFDQFGRPDLCPESITLQNPSKFFVKLLDYSKDASGAPGPDPSDGVMYIVTELGDHSLRDYIQARRRQDRLPSPGSVRKLVRSVVMATAALHAKGYVHLDLKPENMMIFNGRLKIIDVDGCVRIGTTLSLQDSSSSFSPCYCAPELARLLLSGGAPEIIASPSLDSWSIGLIACECVTLNTVMRPAFAHFRKETGSATDAYVAFMDWLARLETSPVPQCVENFDTGLSELLSRGLLACDPELRLTPAQCLSSQYLVTA